MNLSLKKRILLADDGPGIAPEARTKIFEKFGSLETRAEGTYHSAGLGLAFCKLAVEAQGGAIGVDDRPGGGSLFWFDLPADHVAGRQPSSQQPRKS